MPLRRTQETEPTVVTNDPKKWWLRKLQHDGANLKTLNEIVELSAMESRSRFKEETIRALEKDIHYEEGQIEDAVQEREGGAEGEIEESEIKIKVLKEAIETIKGL